MFWKLYVILLFGYINVGFDDLSPKIMWHILDHFWVLGIYFIILDDRSKYEESEWIFFNSVWLRANVSERFLNLRSLPQNGIKSGARAYVHISFTNLWSWIFTKIPRAGISEKWFYKKVLILIVLKLCKSVRIKCSGF